MMWLRHFLCALWFGHRRKFLAVEVRVPPVAIGYACDRFWHGRHYLPDHLWLARWVCTRCDMMGEKCLGYEHEGAWTILNGQIVPDEKKWANFQR